MKFALILNSFTNKKIIGESGNSTHHLDRPKSLTFDVDGNLYVADVGNSRVQKFSINNTACLLSESK
jgi:hypothetical protein